MIRFFAGATAVALIVVAALFFAENPGHIAIAWHGWEIDTSVGVALVLLALAIVVLGLCWKLAAGFVGAPTRYLSRRRETHRLRGFRDLTRGLVAIAAGDGREAERHRARAEAAFRKGRHEQPPLALLLSAQAALLRGDADSAKTAFSAMLHDSETAFLGYRGLIIHAAKSGDDRTALQLAEKARRLRPGSTWVLQHQLALEARLGNWRAAGDTLRDAVRRRAIAAQVGRHYKMALLLARSQLAKSGNHARDALAFAAQAHGLEAGFAPAASHYANLLRDGGRSAKGLRILEAAWTRQSHPELAATYDSLLADEAPATRARRFERLVDLRPNDPEAHLAGAAVALSAQLWGEARRHLERAGAQGPGPWSQRLCRLMAELERHEQRSASSERLWLERAARAPRDPVWICRDCRTEYGNWAAICPNCQSFASLQWETPSLTPPPDRPPAEAVILPPDSGARATSVVPPTPDPQQY